jgi:hypothetical protein
MYDPTLALALTMVALAACQSETKAPFFDPSGRRGDGGSSPSGIDQGDGGMRRTDGGTQNTDGGVMTGMPEPSERVFANVGVPLLDPTQVYLRGGFQGIEAIDVRGESCDDGGPGAIADWSSNGDWETTNGVTVAIPCDVEDVQIRLDGTVIYAHDSYGPRGFVQEPPTIEGTSIILPNTHPETTVQDADYIGICVGSFRSYVLDPEDGSLVANCDGPAGITHFAVSPLAEAPEPVDFPASTDVVHLGFGDVALLHQAEPEALSVANGDDVIDVGELPFEFRHVAAIRAEPDGFVLLVVGLSDPPSLRRWRISKEGVLSQGDGDYPDASSVTFDPRGCVTYRRTSLAPSTEFDVRFMSTRGCLCALDPDDAALCIARDRDGAQEVVRLEPGAPEPTVEFQIASQDPAYLTYVMSLLTGP